MHFLERLIGLGAHEELPPSDRRRVRLCNMSALIATTTALGFALAFALASVRSYAPIVVLNLVGTVVMALPLVWNARGAYRVARICIMTAVNLQILLACIFAGRELGFQAYFYVFPPVTLLLMPGRVDRIARWVLAAASPLFYLFVEHHPAAASGLMHVPAMAQAPIRAVSTVLTFATLVFVVYLFYVDTLRAGNALSLEHERSESLLRNILPASIAKRLKSQRGSIADGFAEVSVLFADLVGFTELSGRMLPADLVQLLNRVFSEFDDLTERRGLEKIKTIGDAYMVAAGLPEPRPDHAHAVARFAFDMLAVVERINRESGQRLALRIGIHTGPVVAGVIGKRKFIYDLWGDTVNIASRMESHGVPGEIQVTAEVARRIGDEFELSEERAVQIKGKGEMLTRMLVRRKITTLPRPGGAEKGS
jgi:adenylate cyclase